MINSFDNCRQFLYCLHDFLVDEEEKEEEETEKEYSFTQCHRTSDKNPLVLCRVSDQTFVRCCLHLLTDIYSILANITSLSLVAMDGWI